MKRTVLVTGGFDPLHSGHIAYFKEAKKLGDKLIVGVNTDEWLVRKKGRSFMPFHERVGIIKELSMVDKVISFNDSDDTACQAIFHTMCTNSGKVIFANGGDRTNTNIPEMKIYGDHSSVELVFGVGGENKMNSSSWILQNWTAPKVNRDWGYYRELYKGEDFQVKELVINPHSKLSMQRHEHRSETWNIVHGKAHLKCSNSTVNPFDGCVVYELHPNNPVDVPKHTWHQGCNDSDEPAHIVEIWKGKTELLTEADIERYDIE
mgnify:CR=1 FL=1